MKGMLRIVQLNSRDVIAMHQRMITFDITKSNPIRPVPFNVINDTKTTS